MKNLYPLFLSLFFAGSMLAQPVIDNIEPNIGDSWPAQIINDVNLDPGPGGANQNWDFSGVDQSNAFDVEFNILAPSAGLVPDSFPNADFIWYISGFDLYNYYESRDDEIVLWGGASGTSGNIDIITVYQDEEDGIQLPLEYGDNYTYYSEFTTYIFNISTSDARNGSVSADGYGTLTTPYGTYEDVLRIKVMDTTQFLSTISTQYAWYQEDNFMPLMVYEFTDDTYEAPSVYFTQGDVASSVSAPVPFAEVKVFQHGQQIEAQFSLAQDIGKLQWQVVDYAGKAIRMENTGQLSRGQHTLNLDLPPLPDGPYLLVLQSEAGQKAYPFSWLNR